MTFLEAFMPEPHWLVLACVLGKLPFDFYCLGNCATVLSATVDKSMFSQSVSVLPIQSQPGPCTFGPQTIHSSSQGRAVVVHAFIIIITGSCKLCRSCPFVVNKPTARNFH